MIQVMSVRPHLGQAAVPAVAAVCSLGLTGYFLEGYLRVRHVDPVVPRTVLAAARVASSAPAARFVWLLSMALGLAVLLVLVVAAPPRRGLLGLLTLGAIAAVGLSLRFSPAWPSTTMLHIVGPASLHEYGAAALLAVLGALLYAAQVLVLVRQARGPRAS
jgi:hypothetical protein